MDQTDLFSRQGREFMCCWGQLHSTFGTFLIACVTLIVSLISSCLAMVCLDEPAGIFISMYLFMLAVASVFVFIALRTEHQYFLTPLIALFIVNLVISGGAAFVSVWMLTSPSSTPSRHLLSVLQNTDSGRFGRGPALEDSSIVSRMVGFTGLGVSLVMVPVILYSTRVIYKSYNFLLNLGKANKRLNAMQSVGFRY